MNEAYRNRVRWWLACGAFLVIAMIVIGGITRLTHSGLSMVDWKPISGIVPPLNEADWQVEFDNYKQYPEYQKKNYNFSLEEFKGIFWWEYIHRVLGRLIGIVFIVPYAWFLFRRVFDRKWNIRLVILFLLGGLQGLIGWFMVKSGLVDNPAVSHYRLAIHFSTALSLYCYILWLYWDLSPVRPTGLRNTSLRRWSMILLVLVALQIVYGAFVAGLKAGLIINTWPLMGDRLISPIVGNALTSTGILSLVEEPVTVQFIHRSLPYLILIPIVLLFIRFRREPVIVRPLSWIGGIWIAQFILGILTLLMHVPVSLGVLHQLGAVILLTACWYFIYLNYSRQVSRNL